MHPLFARFLTYESAHDVLSRAQRQEQLEGDDALYAGTAAEFPDAREALLNTPPDQADDEEMEQLLVLLGAHATRKALELDPEAGPALTRAREALKQEGAADEQADEMFATLLLEEAFGYDDEADQFDREFVLASLGEIPALAALTTERVGELRAAFASSGSNRAVREKVIEALFEAAWGEGPSPINPEHVQSAWDKLSRGQKKPARRERKELLSAVLSQLTKEGLVSGLREKRLNEILERIAGSLD